MSQNNTEKYHGRDVCWDEKSWSWMKHKKDHIETIFWGLVILSLFFSFFLEGAGYVGEDGWFGIFLMGIGASLVIGSILRIVIPEYRKPITGYVVAGFAFIFVGTLLSLSAVENAWIYVILVIGIAVVVSGLRGHLKRDN